MSLLKLRGIPNDALECKYIMNFKEISFDMLAFARSTIFGKFLLGYFIRAKSGHDDINLSNFFKKFFFSAHYTLRICHICTKHFQALLLQCIFFTNMHHEKFRGCNFQKFQKNLEKFLKQKIFFGKKISKKIF